LTKSIASGFVIKDRPIGLGLGLFCITANDMTMNEKYAQKPPLFASSSSIFAEFNRSHFYSGRSTFVKSSITLKNNKL